MLPRCLERAVAKGVKVVKGSMPRRCEGRVVEPDVEKPPLGVFKIVAADDPEISPAPTSQCEAPQRTGFEPDQQRDQNADACDDEG